MERTRQRRIKKNMDSMLQDDKAHDKGCIIRVDEKSGIPLIGCIAFGIIDRGTNLLQVRASTMCNMNCTFCSTDAGKGSRFHKTGYTVDIDYLLDYLKEVCEFKGKGTEINIDSVGEPSMYSKLQELVRRTKVLPEVAKVSMQTNGTLLNKEKIKELKRTGLDEIHLSVHSLKKELSKEMFGSQSYHIEKVMENIDEIVREGIRLILTPVWVPCRNDKDIEDLIMLSKKKGCSIAIQKYEAYRFSRKVKGVRPLRFFKFYEHLERLEKKYSIVLRHKSMENKYTKRKRFPKPFLKGDRVRVEIKAPGWVKGTMLGASENRCVTIIGSKAEIGARIKAKIIEDTNNIFYGTAD